MVKKLFSLKFCEENAFPAIVHMRTQSCGYVPSYVVDACTVSRAPNSLDFPHHEHPLRKRTFSRHSSRLLSTLSHCRFILFILANLPRSHQPQEDCRANVHPPSKQNGTRIRATIESYDLKANSLRDCGDCQQTSRSKGKASLHVVGNTSTNQVMLNALGKSLSPITSVVTGAAVAQNVPATMPPTRLK